MNVLVLTNMYPCVDAPARGTFVAEQVQDLRSAGVEVEVAVIRGDLGSRRYASAVTDLRARVARSRPDLVHAHYGLSGAVALAQRRVPVVTTFHGSDVSYIRWQRYISAMVARASTPIFVSKRDAARMGRGGAPVIPFGVDMSLFVPRSRDEVRTELGWQLDERYVVFPGSFQNPVKNAPLFRRSIRRAESDTQTPIHQVELVGYTRAKVAEVLTAADAVVMTSLSEGAPVTIKEALAVGTPVVSVDVGDVRSTIDNLPGCGVVERDPGAIAAALTEAMATRAPDPLRARAREFDRRMLIARTLDVYAGAAR